VQQVTTAETRILIARGHHATPWGLLPWAELPKRFRTEVLVTGSQRFSLDNVPLPLRRVKSLRDRLPPGPLGEVGALALGDRVLAPHRSYGDADIVHTEELSLWFAGQAARLKSRLGFRLVVTVWETIPALDAFRYQAQRRNRHAVLAKADLFLAATERARNGLLLEGVPEDRVAVLYPGVDIDRFASTRDAAARPNGHVIISPGRLEWEKGHQDVLRAVAAIRRGLVGDDPVVAAGLSVLLVGAGPERERLRAHARELGIGDAVKFRSVPYDEMPGLYAQASCLTLASLPRSSCALTPWSKPMCFWEEQFGLVIAEAMAAGLPLVLSDSGAIPEVAGDSARYFQPGDWMALARELVAGPLSRPPAQRVDHPRERVTRYSAHAAARRLESAYDRVLSNTSR
jgi:glycosyltransferase involved in cell wall biosynthesis